MSDATARSALSAMVAATRTPRRLADSVLRYGRLLAATGDFGIAEDVFATAAECGLAFGQRDRFAEAEERRGWCLRHLGHFKSASAAYMNCVTIAAIRGVLSLELRGRLGQAGIAIARGNFPAAEALLDEVISEAQEDESCIDVLGRAYHSRGIVAHGRQQYATALHLYADALRLISHDRVAFYRVKVDMGRALRERNRPDAARLAFDSVRLDSPEPAMRDIARINLIALAAASGDRALFDRMAGEISLTTLSPRVRVLYEYEFGSGLQQFGQREHGRRLMAEAMAGARKYGLHDVAYHAETELSYVEATPKEETAASFEAAVARAVRELSRAG